jgi:hypothetical protein
MAATCDARVCDCFSILDGHVPLVFGRTGDAAGTYSHLYLNHLLLLLLQEANPEAVAPKASEFKQVLSLLTQTQQKHLAAAAAGGQPRGSCPKGQRVQAGGITHIISHVLLLLLLLLLQEANPEAVAPKASEFKQVRRTIAQLLTLLREREIEAGIGRKESRQLRKEAKVAAGFGRF